MSPNTHSIYWLTYHRPDGKPLGRMTLSDKLPEDAPNLTATGEQIGLDFCYDSIKQIGHLVVPEKYTSSVDAKTDTVTLSAPGQTWSYGIYDMLREGVATQTGGERGGPCIIRVK